MFCFTPYVHGNLTRRVRDIRKGTTFLKISLSRGTHDLAKNAVKNHPKRFNMLQADGCRPLRIRLSDQTDPTLQGRSRLQASQLHPAGSFAASTLQGRSRLRASQLDPAGSFAGSTLQGRSRLPHCITFYSRLII